MAGVRPEIERTTTECAALPESSIKTAYSRECERARSYEASDKDAL